MMQHFVPFTLDDSATWSKAVGNLMRLAWMAIGWILWSQLDYHVVGTMGWILFWWWIANFLAENLPRNKRITNTKN